MINRTDDAEVALYRLFGEDGALLYVGIADEPLNRWGGHRKREWWPAVRTYRVDWYPSRSAADLAERAAIKAEHPLHNISCNGVPYNGMQFPGLRLHELAAEHFGDRAFSCQDLEQELGMPYGSAVGASKRLVDEGAFVYVGKRKTPGSRYERKHYAVAKAPAPAGSVSSAK